MRLPALLSILVSVTHVPVAEATAVISHGVPEIEHCGSNTTDLDLAVSS